MSVLLLTFLMIIYQTKWWLLSSKCSALALKTIQDQKTTVIAWGPVQQLERGTNTSGMPQQLLLASLYSIKMKIIVYIACVMSTLFYSTKSWTTYSRWEKDSTPFHLWYHSYKEKKIHLTVMTKFRLGISLMLTKQTKETNKQSD